MGVYGNNLLYFTEQMRSLIIFNQTAKINGGWVKDENSERTVRGIFQNTRPCQIKDSNGNSATSSGFEFWSEDGTCGESFTQIKNKVYRLVSLHDWDFEGGFYKYSLEKVVGSATESDNATWNLGSNFFG